MAENRRGEASVPARSPAEHDGAPVREEPVPMLHGDIAIVGMACLFPGAPDLATFWQNIVSKVDAITDPPAEAWDAGALYDPDSSENDRTYCKRGGFLGPLAWFDPLEHNVMPVAVQGGEPDQWLALRVARAALADAGYADEVPDRHRAAVILGKGNYPNRGNATGMQHGLVVEQTLQILRALHPEYTEADLRSIRQELKRCLPPFNADTAPGLIPNIVVGRIANRLDLMGPSYTVDAACASFLVALDAAVRSLRLREIDMALVGGVHAWTPAPMLMLFCQLGALSRRQQIRPFDKQADGTILGEGIGMVVIRRREDAEREGSRIYALIKGVGVSSDGRGLGVLAPRVEGEVLALERAYASAGVSPRTVQLVEGHGTGTPAGDVVEIRALAEVFGPRSGPLPRCAVGSVKSMVGHLMPAAGSAGLIKAALSLYHKTLPPTLHVDEPNPKLGLDTTPFYINSETRPWIHAAVDAPRRAGVNGFGFGGINAHVVLEEYPDAGDAAIRSHLPGWDSEVCLLSAPSRAELVQRLEQVQRFLRDAPRVRLTDVAYTLNVPPDGGAYRLAVVSSTIEDLQKKLGRAAERLADPRCRQIKEIHGIYFFEHPVAASGRLAFLFPGEGSQYLSMLADLCIHFPEVRRHFEAVDRAFAVQARDFLPSELVFPPPAFSAAERRRAEERLSHMEGAVEAVVTANRALFALVSRLGISPDAVLGHSSGEYSAMLASGMIELPDGDIGEFARELNQVYRQAAVEGEIPRATLVAVGTDVETISACLEEAHGEVSVAMDNCPHQTVIVGPEEAIEGVMGRLRERGAICERLSFDRPYHTPMFEGFARKLGTFFARWLRSAPRLPTYTCTTASPFPSDAAESREVAVAHWMQPVEFRRTVEAMYADGIRVFVEVGPRGNLTAFVDDILRGLPHLAVPANTMNRSGITQLNHLVGMLAAQGVPMRLDFLYADRSPRKLALDQPGDAGGDGRPSPGRMKLVTGWPAMSLSPEMVAGLRDHRPETGVAVPAARSEETVTKSPPPGIERPRTPAVVPVSDGGRAAPAARSLPLEPAPSPPRERTSRPQPVSEYLRTMEQFLGVQEEVLQAFLGGRPARVAPQISSPPPVAPEGTASASRPATRPDGDPPPIDALTRPSAGSRPDPSVRAETSLRGVDNVGAVLLELVGERTGYPIEMLDPDVDLEADLGVDSIKRVEILGAYQRRTGPLRPDEMEALAGRKTLRQLISFLTNRQQRQESPVPGSPAGVTRFPSTAAAGPLIGTVVSLKPGEELVARREIDLAEDRFLLDHALGGQVSVTDPELRGLPVLPLTMSMEMMAEAGATLVPGQRLLGMRDVRAHRWAALDDGRLTVTIVARRDPIRSAGEVHVGIHEGEVGEVTAGPSLLVEGVMIFGERGTEPPRDLEFPLRDERPSRWTPEELYQGNMFHGPRFRGVVSVDRTGTDGALATLEVRSARELFRSTPEPALRTDPVLLDQPGQVVAFWAGEHLATGYVIFPFRVERLSLYGPNLDPGERVQCRVRIRHVDDRQMRSDLDIVTADGCTWARFVGWEDRRFDLPEPFFRALSSLRDVRLCARWRTPLAHVPSSELWECYRLGAAELPGGFLEAHEGFWARVVAHMVLARREREAWRGLKGPMKRRTEWLLGRMAAKDAVREYLKRRHGIDLCPADVEIWPDEHGRPVAQGAWTRQVESVPALSLSHSDGVAAAVAGDVAPGSGVGLDIERARAIPGPAEALAFTPAERALLSSAAEAREEHWPLRFWCAKEAVAKALGRGMLGGPQALEVKAFDPDTGVVHVSPTSAKAERDFDIGGEPVVAYTTRERDLIAATALGRRERSERAER